MSLLRLFAQTSSLRVLGGILQLAFTFSIARMLPTAQAGAFFFELALITIVGAVARLGTEASALREVAIAYHSPSPSQTLEREIYSRVLLAGSFTLVLGVSYAISSGFGVTHVGFGEAALVAVALVCSSLSGLSAEVLKATDRPGVALVVQNAVMPAVATAMLVVCGWFLGGTLALALISITVGYAAALIIAVVALVVIVPPRRWAGFRAEAGPVVWRHIVKAPVLMGGVVAPVAMQWSGSLILGVLASPSAVALYTVAARLASVVGLINSAAASVIGPRLAMSSNSGDRKRFATSVHSTSLAIASMSIVPILSLTCAAGWAMSFFGESYAQGALVLQCLMLGQLVAALIGHGGQALVSAGRYNTAAIGPAAAVISYVLLLVLLVPAAQAVGAAIAMTCGVIAGHLSAAVGLRWTEGIWPVPVRRRDWALLRRQS